MKPDEQARGHADVAVKVTAGFFPAGLSNVESGGSRNLQLLKARAPGSTCRVSASTSVAAAQLQGFW